MSNEKHFVCTVEELKNAVCLGWEKMVHDEPIQCFIVYWQHAIYSYKNHCPHTGVNLNWMPHQFLDNSGQLIQCAMHGALFDIEDGLCIRGPCLGEGLTAVENVIANDKIYLIL